MKAKLKFSKKSLTLLTVIALLLVAAVISAVLIIGRLSEKRDYDNKYETAMVYYIGGDYDGAIAMLGEARRISDTEECALLLARSYAAKDDYPAAVAVLEGWLRGGDSPEADRLLTEYRDKLSEEGGGESVEIAGQNVAPDVKSLIIRNTDVSPADMTAIGGLSSLTSLTVEGCEIADISALSGLSELTSLILSGNAISDLSPLADLSNLRTLYLDKNPITDFSPLYGLGRLTLLSIKEIEITQSQLKDLEEALPLCGIQSEEALSEAVEISLGGVTFMSDVTELDLSGKGIDDISVLSQCTALTTLNLKNNSVSDLTALVDLPNLTWLCIWNNKVTDLSPLMGLTGLQYLDADGNKITKIAALTELTELTELYLNGNPLKNVSPLLGLAKLEKLGLKNTGLDDGDLTALAALTGLRELSIDDNGDLTGDAVDKLKLALPGCSVSHSELVYRIKLGSGEYKSTDATVDASGKSVKDITDVTRFRNLTALLLNNNKISDISPLYTLSGLEVLELSGNGVSDIGPLKNHTKLRVLDLMKNKIKDITALGSCTALTELHLSYNAELSDISALSACTGLTQLSLDYTAVTDLTALSELKKLVTLSLDGCAVTDPSPLYSLSGLRTLYIGGSGLTEAQIAELSVALPKCEIYGQ